MHFISETRYNPRTQSDDCYYRIKESFRDLTGRPRHRLMLTVGFIDENLSPYDIRDIGRCLTWLLMSIRAGRICLAMPCRAIRR